MTEAFRQPKNSVTAEVVISSNELYFSELPAQRTLNVSTNYLLVQAPQGSNYQVSTLVFPLM